MAPISRGFRRRHPDDGEPAGSRPASTSSATSPCSRRARRPAPTSPPWSFSIGGEIDERHAVDLGRVPGAPARDGHEGHPLRHEVVEARHDLAGRLARHAARRRRDRRPTSSTAYCDGGYTTNLPLEDLLDGKAWVAYSTTASRSTPSTAARPGCSCRTCTSGRAPSGCAASTLLDRGRARVLGAARLPRVRRPMARAAVPGGLSSRAVAWRTAARAPSVARRDADRPHLRPRRRPTGPATSPASTSTSA